MPFNKKRSVETKAAPDAPTKGHTEQHKARRSLSGAWSKHCF